MAGLWDVWEGDDETISCVTILTTEPNDLMNSIHDRMPVVLPQDTESDWLAADSDTRKELCQPYPKDDLDAYEISTRVNIPGNNDLLVIEQLDHEQSGLGEFMWAIQARTHIQEISLERSQIVHNVSIPSPVEIRLERGIPPQSVIHVKQNVLIGL